MIRRQRLKTRVGCLTCRRRKKKCDDLRPVCTACQRLNFSCEWPDQDAQASAESSSARRLNPTWEVQISPVETPSSDSMLESTRVQRENAGAAIPMHPDLSGFRDQISVSHFVNVNLNAGELPTDESAGTLTCSIRLPLLLMGTGPSAASACLEACGLASLARANNDGTLEREATQRYVSCLQNVNDRLRDRLLWKSTDTHISIILLGMYEWMTTTDGTAWIKHALGLARVIEQRGPQSFTSETDRLLFEYSRPLINSAAFIVRKPSFLATSAWKTVPWVLAQDHRSWQQSYIDISIDMPSCVYDYDVLRSETAADLGRMRETKLMRLYVKCSSIDRRLRKWRRALETRFPELMKDVSQSTLDGFEIISNSRKSYMSLAAAKRIIHYDTSIIVINSTMCDVLRDLEKCAQRYEEPVERDPRSLVLRHGRAAYVAAIEICQSIEFLLLPQHVGAGIIYLIGPMRIAQRCLGGDKSPKGMWIESIVESIWQRTRTWQLLKALKI